MNSLYCLAYSLHKKLLYSGNYNCLFLLMALVELLLSYFLVERSLEISNQNPSNYLIGLCNILLALESKFRCLPIHPCLYLQYSFVAILYIYIYFLDSLPLVQNHIHSYLIHLAYYSLHNPTVMALESMYS